MEVQGVTVTRTKKGLLLRLPDGSSTVKHFTESDVRGNANLMARLRRAGVVHPDDPKGPIDTLPMYVTEGGISAETKRLLIESIARLGFPAEVRVPLVHRDTGWDHVKINRALFHTGFKPVLNPGSKGREKRVWITPDDILSLKESVTVDKQPEPVAEVVEEVVEESLPVMEPISPQNIPTPPPITIPPMPDVVKNITEQQREPEVQVEEGREFIDSEDSWTLDLSNKPAHMILSDYLRVLETAGLEYEIRVWRKR